MPKKIIFLLTFIGVILLNFQNCSTKINPMMLESSSLASSQADQIPLNHPPTVPVQLTFQKNLVVNRDYVKSLMLEVFTGHDGPSTELENIVEQWASQKGSQFGLGCDTTSSYTGRDCGGDPSASNLAQFVDHNSVRESYHVQLCQRILAYDNAVSKLIEKVENPLVVPNKEAIIQVYNLFYRGDDPDANTINSLIDLDHSLAANKEPPIERWRALILQICESPAWQGF